jgi:hypothetical protein
VSSAVELAWRVSSVSDELYRPVTSFACAPQWPYNILTP